MAQVQNSLPASTLPADASPAPVSQTADKEALLARLDALLEQYLHALAQYEVLTQQLGRGMGSGFLALAQANFHTRGPRYGRDSYDGRVQAVRRVAVTATASGSGSGSGSAGGSEWETGAGSGAGSTETVRFDAFSTLAPRARQRGEDGDGVGESAAVDKSGAVETAQSAAPDTSSTTDPSTAHPPTSPPNPPHSTNTDTDADTDTHTTPPAPTDPLRMFGVLVPPALRTAQAHFAAAVEGPVVGLASVAARLRALEREIGRVRKGIRRA